MLAVLCIASYDRTQVMCVAVVALLLLSQRCSAFVMSVGVWLWIGKDYTEFSGGQS